MGQDQRQEAVKHSHNIEELKFKGQQLEKEVESRTRQIAELATHAETLRSAHYAQVKALQNESD